MPTRIEWADEVWEPVSGCTKVSEGCRNCYAERLAKGRLRRFYPEGFGKVRLIHDRLDQPFCWRRPRRIFVCGRSDLFHENVPAEFLDKVFAVMALAGGDDPGHTFLVLTKRPDRMLDYMVNQQTEDRVAEVAWELMHEEDVYPGACMWIALGRGRLAHYWPSRNVWLGVSVEDQRTADERIPLLLQTPAAVHFVSCEPLLAPVDLTMLNLGVRPGALGKFDAYLDAMAGTETDEMGFERKLAEKHRLHWVIVGAESGPNRRPMKLDWVRFLREQAQAAGVLFYFKQMFDENGKKVSLPTLDDRVWAEMPERW